MEQSLSILDRLCSLRSHLMYVRVVTGGYRILSMKGGSHDHGPSILTFGIDSKNFRTVLALANET